MKPQLPTESPARLCLALAPLLTLLPLDVAAAVDLRQEPVVYKTHLLGPDEATPAWDQGVYPYSMRMAIGDKVADKTYNGLVLENDYIRALVLPDIGGRLHGAWDKSNGYAFLYDQKTIKPALVGSTGAWISGGIEFNFPFGHRPSGFRPVDYALEENPDGSRTAWTGEIDRMTGMRWAVGITVHPGRSWIEIKHRLENRTPVRQSFDYWDTAAVRATPNYQAVIPGDTWVGHGFREFGRWPISEEGVDLRWWKNLPEASSHFAYKAPYDFFGGYSPEYSAGTAHVADHLIVPGKKLWTWGTDPAGRMWERILTDGDLPYFEPQAGAFSTNQPDRHRLQPGEIKVFSTYWFPVGDIGVWDYANLEGAVNLERRKDSVFVGWSPTAAHKAARVSLLDGVRVLSEWTVDASPAKPFTATSPHAAHAADGAGLQLQIRDASGAMLLDYTVADATPRPLPPPQESPGQPDPNAPTDALDGTVNALLAANDADTAHTYVDAILQRDPGDSRALVYRGIDKLAASHTAEALEDFSKAGQRDSWNGEPFYYQGLALRRLGRLEEASTAFAHAAHDATLTSAANYELAAIRAKEGRPGEALQSIERCLDANAESSRALGFRAGLLRQAGRPDDALAAAEALIRRDPLAFRGYFEKAAALAALGREQDASGAWKQLWKITRGVPFNLISLADELDHCGSPRDALMAMGGWDPAARAELTKDPLAAYHAAYLASRLGDDDLASKLRLAARHGARGDSPNAQGDFAPLQWALDVDPSDPRANALLGDLYFSRGRSDDAIACWRLCLKGEPDNAVAWRNLGFALAKEKPSKEALQAYDRSLELDPSEIMTLTEADRLAQNLDESLDERAARISRHVDTTGAPDTVMRLLVPIRVLQQRWDDVMDILRKTHFHSWEGRYDIHDYWVAANLALGDKALAAGNTAKALESYREAMQYPDNLEVQRRTRTVASRQRYKQAQALKALGRNADADAALDKLLAEEALMSPSDPNRYYVWRVLKDKGRDADAAALLQKFKAACAQAVEDHPVRWAARIHGAYALALDAAGDSPGAAAEHAKALSLDPMVDYLMWTYPVE